MPTSFFGGAFFGREFFSSTALHYQLNNQSELLAVQFAIVLLYKMWLHNYVVPTVNVYKTQKALRYTGVGKQSEEVTYGSVAIEFFVTTDTEATVVNWLKSICPNAVKL
jgi:hypothetical protein